MRSLLLLLALLPATAANASAITFDFETLPDSAGCAVAVSSYGGAIHPSCDQLWVIDNSFAGLQREIVDTEQGLTMEIDSNNQAIWWNGNYMCGNSPSCSPYVASFSQALSGISVDFSGIGSGDAILDGGTFAYSVSAYSGEFGTGTLLGTTTFGGFLLPDNPQTYAFPMTLMLSDLGDFRSVSIAALALSDGNLRNLARIDAIHASVPEPSTLVLLGAALFAMFFWKRSPPKRLRDVS